MATTQDYVSAAGTEGNDYKGASFTDGAYTKATKTLTKAGAFTASKVNHYIYITGTHITSGYYKISDVSGAPNAVVLATEASSDGNDSTDVHCTQHDGTALLPWRSLQGAFDLLTRNTTDGNQVNLKAGTAQVNAAALSLTTFIAGGALSATAPLIVRGYTAAANDGGIGEIDCGGATMWASAYDYVIMADLDCHSFGDNAGVSLGGSCILFRCKVHKGASSPSAKNLVNLTNASRIIGCYIYDAGASTARGCNAGNTLVAYGNYIAIGSGVSGVAYALVAGTGNTISSNIIVCAHAGTTGLYIGIASVIANNVIYNTAAGTGDGVYLSNSTLTNTLLNNVIIGWSGAGGTAVDGANVGLIGFSGLYNNTANYALTDQAFIDLTASDVALGADPFTSAATGDFSLTAAGKAALRGLGWPAAYLGAHANTDGHITIGAVQYGEAEAGGGGMLVGNKRANKEG